MFNRSAGGGGHQTETFYFYFYGFIFIFMGEIAFIIIFFNCNRVGPCAPCVPNIEPSLRGNKGIKSALLENRRPQGNSGVAPAYPPHRSPNAFHVKLFSSTVQPP